MMRDLSKRSSVVKDYESVNMEAVNKDNKRIRACLIAAALCVLVLIGCVLYAAGVFKPRDIEGIVQYCIRRGETVPAVKLSSYVAVNDRLAEYSCILQVHSADLKGCIGEVYVDDIYRPKGTKNLKYLIFDHTGEPSLWVFDYFIVRDTNEFKLNNPERVHGLDPSRPLNLSPYTYADAAEVFYGMAGPEDIERITVRPPNFDTTREGKALRKEIGTQTVRDREAIERFYDVLTRTVCVGATGGRGILDLPDRFSYSFSPPDPEGKRTYADRQRDGEAARAARYLTVTMTDGTIVDQWKYDAIKGCFYEYGGIVTEPLDEADVYALNAIFGIE